MRWCDLDLDAGIATISQQVQQYDGHIVVGPPKTARSARTIALDHSTVTALRRHRQQQTVERKSGGAHYEDSGFVFTGLNGGPMAPDGLSRTFQKLTAEAGLPPIRLHDLRHGAATLALSAGVDLRVVQDMLGHCSIVLTADLHPGPARHRAQGRRASRRARPARRPAGARHPPTSATSSSAARHPRHGDAGGVREPRSPGPAGSAAAPSPGRRLTHPDSSYDRSAEHN